MSRKSHSIPEACAPAVLCPTHSPDSLGSAKPSSFGTTLRRAIKANFGTSRAFAAALGVTEGRVSQLVNGAESITPSTLEEILAVFDDVGLQETIHKAWSSTFAPSPLTLTSALESHALAERLLTRFSSLLSSGNAKTLLSTLRHVAPGIDKPELRFRLQRAIIDLALYLERPSLARDAAAAMLNKAKELGSNRWIATALYARATASRLDHTLGASDLVQLHDEFVSFMSTWSPSAEEKAIFESLRLAAIRDRGLTLLAGFDAGSIRKESLAAGTEQLRRFTRASHDPIERAVALEVLGRLLIAEGALFAAEDTLDEVRAIHGPVSYDHAPKTKLLSARLLIARQEFDGANHLLMQVIDVCFDTDALHHARVAEGLRLKMNRSKGRPR